jgi:hypothetical protein
MKLCQTQTVALTFLLVLLPAVGQSQRAGTPIIVGDGSVHIRSEGAPFFDPADGNWDKSKKNEFHRKGSGVTGQYGKVSLVGCQKGDWSKFEIIGQPLVDFNADAKDKCKVVLTIGSPPKPEETVTIEDEKGKQGMVIRSSVGLAGIYAPKDKPGTELVRNTANQITKIDIYTRSTDPPKVLDEAFIKANCRTKYSGCGIAIEYSK